MTEIEQVKSINRKLLSWLGDHPLPKGFRWKVKPREGESDQYALMLLGSEYSMRMDVVVCEDVMLRRLVDHAATSMRARTKGIAESLKVWL